MNNRRYFYGPTWLSGEHLIKNSFTLKSNEFDYDVLMKNVKFGLISYETAFFTTQKSNHCQNTVRMRLYPQ